MGARDDEQSPDPPPVGLIDRWLAHRGGGAEKPPAAASSDDAPGNRTSAPRSPITSAKERLAAARRAREGQESSSRALAERLAGLVAREKTPAEAARARPSDGDVSAPQHAAPHDAVHDGTAPPVRPEPSPTPAPSPPPATPVADEQPESAPEQRPAEPVRRPTPRRNPGAEILAALDAPATEPEPATAEASDEADPSSVAPTDASNAGAGSDGAGDNLISALRALPARSAGAQLPRRGGKHRAETPTSRRDDAETGAPMDPALRQTLLAVEAAEASAVAPKRRRGRRRAKARRAEPSAPPPVPTETPEELLAPPEPAAVPEGSTLPTEDGEAPVDLDPTVAAALRARLDAVDTEPTKTARPASWPPVDGRATPRAKPPSAARAATPARARPSPSAADAATSGDDVPSPTDKTVQVAVVAGAPTARRAAPPVEPPTTTVRFSPRRSTHQTVGVLMLVCALATVGAGFLAWETRATSEIAIAATLAVLTLILWSAFTTSHPPRLVVDRGVLQIESKQSRHQFDLSSPWLELEVRGRPGRRGWQVRIQRRSMAPFVIDSSMVDPREFQPVLDECREVARQRTVEMERRREGR